MSDDRGPAWVYRIYDADWQLLYIGVTTNLVMRLAAHGNKWWGYRIAKTKAQVYRTRSEAAAVEKAAIRAERPRFNVMHRDASPLARRSWTAENYDDLIAVRSREDNGDDHGRVAGYIARLRNERIARFGEPTGRSA